MNENHYDPISHKSICFLFTVHLRQTIKSKENFHGNRVLSLTFVVSLVYYFAVFYTRTLYAFASVCHVQINLAMYLER